MEYSAFKIQNSNGEIFQSSRFSTYHNLNVKHRTNLILVLTKKNLTLASSIPTQFP